MKRDGLSSFRENCGFRTPPYGSLSWILFGTSRAAMVSI